MINKEGDKELLIKFSLDDDKLSCIVEDNGIGREKAAEIRERKIGVSQFASKGTMLSKQRIMLLNQQFPNVASIGTTDLINVEGQSKGTRVVITLPSTITDSKLTE